MSEQTLQNALAAYQARRGGGGGGARITARVPLNVADTTTTTVAVPAGSELEFWLKVATWQRQPQNLCGLDFMNASLTGEQFIALYLTVKDIPVSQDVLVDYGLVADTTGGTSPTTPKFSLQDVVALVQGFGGNFSSIKGSLGSGTGGIKGTLQTVRQRLLGIA